MTTVIDTPEGIAHARLLALRGRLQIEINTGLRFKGRATSTIIKEEFGWKGNKQSLLRQLDALIAGVS